VNAPSVRFPGRLAAEVAVSFAASASRRLHALRPPLGRRSASPAMGRSASFSAGCPRFAGQRTASAYLSRSKARSISSHRRADRARPRRLQVLLSFTAHSASRRVVAMHCKSASSKCPIVSKQRVGLGWHKEVALAWVELSVRPVGGSGCTIRPNHSIERTFKTLRVLRASHVKRYTSHTS
jgi:hypothetical protein